MDFIYTSRAIRHHLFRLSAFRHRDVHAHFATAQQSGTHWLCNLVASVVSTEYGVPPLTNIRDDSIIGPPRKRPTHPQIPRLVRTHHAPSWLAHAKPFRRALRYPRYVVLLRDMRAALVSRYERMKDRFDLSFEEYLRDHRLFGRAHTWDLYKRIVFFNAWGRALRVMPGQTHIVFYEHLQADAAGELERLWRFLDLPVSDPGVFQRAAARCSKDAMSRKEPPNHPQTFVRRDERDPVDWFSEQDRRYFRECCRRHLRCDFGYDFDDWTSATQPPRFSARPFSRAA